MSHIKRYSKDKFYIQYKCLFIFINQDVCTNYCKTDKLRDSDNYNGVRGGRVM